MSAPNPKFQAAEEQIIKTGSVVRIGRTKAPFGWLGNMSAHPVVDQRGTQWHTAEALFQAMRYERESPFWYQILAERNPMRAKFASKKYKEHRVVVPQLAQDTDNMSLVLALKFDQHPWMRETLARTTGYIAEDCTRRQRGSGLFWGAALKAGTDPLLESSWSGTNALGHILMSLRAIYQADPDIRPLATLRPREAKT